jgi:hypothetical protein
MMNERINQLAKQAGAYMPGPMGIASGHPAVGFQDLELFEKFAELIVKECVQVCLSQRDPSNLNYKPSERFAEAVKQHFGVF